MSILAGLFVISQYSVGRHHDGAASIYRIHEEGNAYTYDDEFFHIRDALGDRASVAALVREEGVVGRIASGSSGIREAGGSFRSDNIFYANPEVFDVFTYPLAEGDAETALNDPASIVLSAQVAARQFPDESPIGRTLTIPSDDGLIEMTVTGVMKPVPANGFMRPDYLVPIANLEEEDGGIWKWINVYARLKPGTEIQDLLASLESFREANDVRRADSPIMATPLTDIYLHTQHDEEIAPTGSFVYVAAFAIVGFLILLIACINYVTITTAQMGERLRSVGLRKTFGAGRSQIVFDFIAESSLTTTFAFVVGGLTALSAIPAFNRIAPRPISAEQLFTLEGVLLMLGVLVFTVALASGYPAFRLSKLRPKELFDQNRRPGGSGLVRKGLVTVQLALAVALTAVTVVIVQQSMYLANKDLGLDREHTLMVNTRYAGTAGESGVLSTDERSRRLDIIEARLRARADVLATGRTAYRPNSDWVFFHRIQLAEGKAQSEIAATDAEEDGEDTVSSEAPRIAARIMFSTEGITEALGLELLDGKRLSEAPEGVIINRKAADQLGEGARAGAPVYTSNMRGDTLSVIAGIVENFHFETLREDIRPVIIKKAGFWREDEYLLVRSEPGETREVRAAVESVWNEVMPPATFDATYMDQEFNAMHVSEYKQRTLLLILAGLTLLVSCIGLIGLVAYVADRRRAEIGVRKTLGASARSIVGLFTRDIGISLAIGSVIALPAAYAVAQIWLDQFAYRISPGVPMFAVAVGVVGVVALTATTSQAYRAATTDVVSALRDA